MCGKENEEMSVHDAMEELIQTCNRIRQALERLTNRKDKETLALRHIQTLADTDVRINDFQRGLEWFNVSEELSVKRHLSGKIVVLDFFTSCCINCMHVLPDLDELEKTCTVQDGLVVVGVHSAKFSNERDSQKILSAVQRYKINHPVVNDAKLSMWRDIGITCWPSLVMLGPNGQLLVALIGEGHKDELFLYAKMALKHFKSLNKISSHDLPLEPAQHLLPASTSTLLFPGKLQAFQTERGERLVVSDTGNNRILIMEVNGAVEYIIGDYSPGFKDGNFRDARFNAPQGVCALHHFIFVADNENHAIRKIDLMEKSVTTVVGTGCQGHDYIGGKYGKDQELSSPWDVAIYYCDNNGCDIPVLLIAMAGTHQIWALFLEDTTWWKKKEFKAHTCTAIVGNGREENRNNCYPHAASLAQPSGLAVAQERKAVFFADSESSSIRRLDMDKGSVSAVCGADKNPSNLHSYGDKDGTRFVAKLQHPLGVAWHASQDVIYIADTYNHKIKKVDVLGNCETLYGNGKPNDTFSFDEPSGLSVGTNGNILYVADTNDHAIKAIDLKENKITRISITFPKDVESSNKVQYTFETFIDTQGGELNISFSIAFKGELKLNPDAPQRWSVILSRDDWVAKAVSGVLPDAISMKVPKGDESGKLHIILDTISCKTTECISKKVSIMFNVHRKPDAPAIVNEYKRLVIE